jgi:hypothetical protein
MKFAFLALTLILTGCGLELGYPDAPTTENDPNAPGYIVFVTQSTVNTGGGIAGVSGADSICNGDANKPATGSYKAMISDGQNRVGTPGSQVNWPVTSGRKYVRTDGTVITTASSAGVFSYPLTNAVTTTTGLKVWTGVTTGYVNGDNCAIWQSSTNATNGAIGVPNAVDTTSYFGGVATCDTSGYHLYCVQQ